MELGHHHLQRRPSSGLVDVDGDAPSVVGHQAGAVRREVDVDLIALPGQGLVNRVVDYLVDEMVEPVDIGGPDVHPRPAPDRLQALQYLDLLGRVPVSLGLATVGAGAGAFGRRRFSLGLDRQPQLGAGLCQRNLLLGK